jgi:LysR family transcriptional regulator for bpeEF and oprC
VIDVTNALRRRKPLISQNSDAIIAIMVALRETFRMSATIQMMKIFVRAVEKNSFTAAARSMFINPAAVSRAVMTLETDLGAVLFARSTRALKLTAEGGRFYRDCTQVLRKFDDATQRFHANGTELRGRLNIGLGSGLPRRMLLRAIPEFQKQYSQIELVLVSVDDAIEIGDKGIDILIRPRSLRRRGGQHPQRQGLVVRKFLQSRFVTCASPGYLRRAGVPSAPSDLCRHACVAPLTMEGDIQNEWQFAKSNVRQNVKFVARLVAQAGDTLREAGISGCGIIRTSVNLIEEEIRSGKLVPVLSDWECLGSPPMVIIYRKTRPILPLVRAFVEYIIQAFQRYDISGK